MDPSKFVGFVGQLHKEQQHKKFKIHLNCLNLQKQL